jgi:hypothetical protein
MNGIIKRHFGKNMTTDTKLRLHTTSKVSLCYGSENWIIDKRDAQKLEAAQIRFLRTLVGLTRLYRQRNPDIHNILEVDNIVEDIKLYQKSWLDQLERMDRTAYRGWLSSTNLQDGGIWENRDEDGETKNTLSFKGIDLMT